MNYIKINGYESVCRFNSSKLRGIIICNGVAIGMLSMFAATKWNIKE